MILILVIVTISRYRRCRDMAKYLSMLIKVIIRSVTILKKTFRKKPVIFIAHDFTSRSSRYIDTWNTTCKGWAKHATPKLDTAKPNRSVLDGEWSEGVRHIASNAKTLPNVAAMLFSIWNDILKMSSSGFSWRTSTRSPWQINSCTVHDVLAQEDIFSHTEMKVFLSLFQSLAKMFKAVSAVFKILSF